MKAIIEKICLFSKDGDMREVSFTSGLNIITGDSQTGKSALVEIVDYCLFSKRSSIPKYVITDFSHLYVVVFRLGEKNILIGRHAWDYDGYSKASVKIETSFANIENLTLDYFDQKSFIPLSNAKRFFEENIGLSVKDTSIENDNLSSDGKASIRNMTSLMFQHQNLIANKHALFYRFEDFSKRDRVIKEMPIFLGWVDGAYYAYRRELDSLEKQVRREERIIKRIEGDIDDTDMLKTLTSGYLSYIDHQIDEDLDFNEMAEFSKNLPDPKEISISNSRQKAQLIEIDQEIEELRFLLSEIEVEIYDIEQGSMTSSSYISNLRKIEKTLEVNSELKEILCPLCKSSLPEFTESIKSITQSRNEIVENLARIGVYNVDRTERLTELFKSRDNIKNELKKITSHRLDVAKGFDLEIKSRSFRDGALYLKGRAEASVEHFLNRSTPLYLPDDIETLKNKISLLKDKIKSYGLDGKYQVFNKKINSLMTSICNRLNFEDELKPVDLHFDIENFEFYQKHKDSKVKLSEMGSGSNWLACHLSLFLSLLILHSQEESAIIPAVLFLDQPSQVYFPKNSGKEKDEDRAQVEKIFNVIIKLVDLFREREGFDIQVIVLEHADHLTLAEGKIFDNYVRKRWSSSDTGERLI